MTKKVCDICGKDMPLELNLRSIKDYNFCISSYGKVLDICDECRNELNKWIKTRKEESSNKDIKIQATEFLAEARACAENKEYKTIKIRDATPEERASISKYINSISEVTDVNLEDIK